ncbi:MAG: Spy0128 family protein [Ruminococcus sp.]
MKKNSRLKSFFAILLAVSMIFQQSSLTVLATDDTYVEDATATPTPSENEAETYATEGAEPVAEKQEEPQQVQETPAAEQAQEPTEAPAEQPTEAPAEQPTEAPAEQPTEAPAAAPTETPATEPTAAPAAEVTEAPAAPEATATPAAEATATPTPEVSAPPSETPTPTPEVTETPAETTEFSDVSVDNAIANVSLSTPISEKAIFVAKQYDEDSEYFDNAIGAVMNWAGQNNLALTEAVVYDLHFENEDGTPYPYGDNATVNLQFNNPILNELEYDNVENVKTYVLHITENGVQDVNGGIAQNGSGAVTGVTIQTNGFSPFVIVKAGSGAVMAVQEGLPSTSLADFITDVKFTDAKTDENGKLILSIGSEYSFDMSFAEVPGVRQLDVENNLVLEYPTQLTPSVQSGTFDIEVIKGKNKYIVSGNTYEVINNKVVVKINKNDTNYEHLKDASNVAFNLHLKAKVSENATGKEIKFNDQVKKDVTFKSDASVSVEKTGTYDKTRGKFIYTVKVTSTGTSKNVKVTDRITGTLLKYADDVVASPDKGSVSATPINNGFVYEIPTMNDGEVITLTYSADIDYSKLPKGAKSFTVDETKNTVSAKGDNTPKSDDKSKDFNNETIATPIKKSGKAEEVKDGKQTSTWTIIVNEDANEYVGGSTVTDILKQNDKAPTDYSGGGLTVNIYNKNGDKVGTETPLWGNGVTKTESGWTYNLPKNANNTPYKYEIIYTTVTDISSVYQDNLKIENEAEHNGESTSGEVSPISKGDKFEVTKDHENATKDSVDWTVTIKIPDTGFNNSFSVTDSLPFTWNNGVPCKDSYMAGTMKVDWNGTTLVEGTHYSINPEDTGSNSIQLKLNFKNVVQLFPKVNAGTNRTLTLTYKTKPDSNWPESESHNNTVTVSGDGTDKTDTDSYKLSEHKIKKEVDGTRTIDGMPAFGFKVQLQGVDSDTITISDNFFDTELFEVYVGRSDVWGMMRFGGGDKPEEAEAAANGKSLGGTVSATPTSTGADFTITNVAKKGNSYYNYYVLRYFLKVKDVAALKKLQQMAADSENHTALISNIATWGDISSEKVSHTFELKPVTKETVDVGSGNDYKASFKIVINPDKLKLNGGNQIDVKDVITVTEGAGAKVRLIPDSLKITLDPAGDYSTDYSEDRTTLNIKIPDECKATITYDAKVDGKGTVKYNNTVDISGGYTASSGEKTVYIESIAGGTAEVFAYTLVKRDAKTKAALNGAKFQLFDVTDNKLLTAFDAKKNRIPLVFTTNENGIVEIRHSDETVSGWSLIEGHRYRLEEIEAPDGYGIADPVTFTVVSSKANAGETIPADGIFNGEEIDVYDAKAEEVDLTATKELTGRNLKDGEFSFELTPDSHNPASDKNAKKTVQNTADGNISFGKLKFTEAGTYKYTVSEITGNDDTITYDNKSYTVTIVVEEGEHGALNIASKTITLNSGAKSEIKFTNAYTPKPTTAQIEAEKSVNGEAATGSQFHFTLTPKTDGDKNEAKNVTNVNGKITFADLTYDKAGTYEYEVAEVQENLPNGYKADKTVYTATVTVTDNKETGKLEAVVSYKKGEKSVDKLTFANTYKAEGTTAKIEAEKTVNGEAATGSQFHFTLTPKTDGDKNEAKNVTNVNGKITFADLTYDKAGTYEYEVAEVQENLPNGYKADKTVYTATVTVTDNKETGKLEAVVSYKKGEKSVDKLTFANTYKAEGTTAKIEAEKTVNGEAATGSQFHFTLTPKTDGDKNEAKNVTNVNGKITFADLTYDKAGTYEYEVAEVQENLPNGYKADKTVYTATVTVTDNKETGKLEAVVSYKKGEKSVDKLTFVNTYKAEGTTAKIEAEKTVNGEAATGSQFHFTLTPKTDGDKNEAKNVTNVNGKITFADLTYDKAGTYEYEVAEVQENLPNGYKADKTVYTATVTITDNKETGKLEAVVSYKKGEKSVDKLTFANTYKAEGTTAEIEAEKTVNGEAATGSQFHFTLTPKTDGDKNEAKNVTNVNGKITFADLTYDKAGTYEYEVAEVQENLPNGYKADKTVYTATVTVTDNKETGKLEAVVSYKKGEKSVDKLTFANTYKAEGTTAKIEAEKTVNGKAATGSQFHFTLTPKTDGDKNEAKNVTNVNGKITFADLTYDKAGTYEYEVAEVQENLPNGYKADKTVYTATVTITDNKETGKLEAVVSYKKGEKSVDKLTFANTYKAEGTTAEIEAEKTVNGEAATGSQFHFTLTPKTDGDKNRSQNVTNVDGKITFADLTYDRDGIYEYEVAEVQEVPNGYTADKTVYKVTVTVTDDMSGQLKAAVSYKKAEEPVDKLTFANIYKASVDLQLKAQKSMKVEAEQLGTFEFELKDADGKVIETVKNDEKGAISFSKLSYTEKDAGRTFAYTVNEKIPLEADTYIYDKTVYTVTVNVEDNRDGTLKLTTKVNGKDYTATAMKFVNDSTKVTITKVNDTDRNALLGAKLQIVDAKDKVVEEWTTDGNPHVIIGKLILGETYKLVEKEAPNGYKIADPITFVMQSDGTITVNAKPVSENQLTMVDSKLHFNVNKVELGSGKEVEGAHLVVIDKETGKTVDEWVSEKDKTHDFGPKLEAGKSYILRETVAPAGYKYATDIEFTVKKDGTIETNAKTTTDTDGNKVYLVEDDTTKVTITKVDALGNQLSGVVLEIQDKDGMVIDTWTTSTKDNPHVITGKLILGETYKLVEKSAPAGYTLADPVEFTVSENDIDNKVEMKNIYSASGSLNLTAKKILTTTETPLAAGQFTFELRDKDGTVLQTKTNDADGNVTFDQIKYNLVKDAAYKDNTDKKVDNTGEYQYTVNEVKGDAAGYTYDDTIYTINVTVTDAGNGTLTVTPVIHSSKATSEDATATGMEFTNTYTTSGQIVLGATKTLEGQTLEAEQFSFQATEMDVDGKAVENGYSETVKNADGGAITFPIITYKESGTHYYQITEVKDEKPAYQYDESKYVVKVDVTDDNAGKLTAKVTSVTKNGELVKSEDLIGAVTFTNTYSASADLELKAQKSMKVEAEQLGTFEFELKDADGKVIETVKNDEKGAISFSKLSYTEKDAGKTFTYTVNEKLPSEADTYVYDKTVYTVTVNVEDNRDGTLKLTTKVNGGDYTETVMKFVNDTTKVTISKVDDTTLKALAGAKLQVVDDQDKVVEEWTSDGTPHVITAKLVLGKTYKLVEEEAPSGYEIAEPITFTVDADDTKNAVEMKDAMTKGKTAAIEITKELKLNDALAGAKDMTFYAALFADAECTISASDVKALEFKNASSSTVTFTNLDLGRTYYVSETDATGKAIDSGMTPDEKVYVPVYPQGQAITVTEDGAKSSITFENQFSEWPDGFYKIATLNVTKKLLGAAGNALESDEIFYAGIFDDKECTTLSTRTEKNILTLDLAGGSTVSESTQAVVIPDEAFTLYVAETDAEGNLVDGTEGFRYAVTVENGNVLFDENNLNAEVTIINQEQPEATPTVTPEETITPTPTPGTSTGVKTGDDTPIGFYMALLFVAALAIEETTRRRRKKEQD